MAGKQGLGRRPVELPDVRAGDEIAARADQHDRTHARVAVLCLDRRQQRDSHRLRRAR